MKASLLRRTRSAQMGESLLDVVIVPAGHLNPALSRGRLQQRLPHFGSEENDDRDAEDGGDFWVGEQAQHRMGHRTEAAAGGLAAGDYVSKRAPGTGSKGPDRGIGWGFG